MKAVFDTRSGSGYDDEVSHRYHFPNRYLPEAQRTIDDWIVYREPRRGGGREGYVAIARVVRIEPDPAKAGHSYAWMADYLGFDAVVPLRKNPGFYETMLDRIPNPAAIGAALQGKSIRTIPDADFAAIARAGLQNVLDPHEAPRLFDPAIADEDVLSLINAPPLEQERRIAQYLANRKIRDAAFRKTVCDAYDNRCAVTGLHIINGGGRVEVQAAHIWSVDDGGPDVVQSGSPYRARLLVIRQASNLAKRRFRSAGVS